jgi:hypothetical protein
MNPFLDVPAPAIGVYFLVSTASEAPNGFDNKTDGLAQVME